MAGALVGTFTAAEGTGNLTTSSRTTTAGNLLTGHAARFEFSGGGASIAWSDSKSNGYTEPNELQILNGGDSSRISQAYNANGTRGTSHTITATFTAGSGSSPGNTLVGHEWSGVEASPTVVSATNNGSSTGPTVSATASKPSLYIGMVCYGGAATTIAPNGPTQASETDENSDFQAQAVAYSVSLTGSNAIAWTLAASRPWGALVSAFSESQPAGGNLVNLRGPGLGPAMASNFPEFRQGLAQATANLSLSIDTAGSITLAGQSVTPSLGLAVTNGAITLAGQSVTPALGLPVTNGAITLAGQSATFSIGVPVSTNGTVTFAGQTATMQLGTVLNIDTAGQITLAGQSATFALGLPVTNGSVTFAGQSVTPSLGLAVSNGAVTFAGQSATFALGLPVSNGTITFAGQSITLANGSSLSLDIDVAGSITFAGQSVTLANSSPVASVGQTPAGKPRKRRAYVEIDGQTFEVSSEAEAVELLQRARAIAEKQSEERAERATRLLKRKKTVPVVKIAAPEITVSASIAEATAPIIADIRRLYRQAAETAELRLLLQKQLEAEEDDDDVLLLL